MGVIEITSALASTLRLGKEAINLLRQVKNLVPTDSKRQEVEQKLREAECSLQLAEAEIVRVSKELGYELCKCTWPPQIMLSKGFEEYDEIFECPKCGRRFPPATPDLQNNWRGAP